MVDASNSKVVTSYDYDDVTDISDSAEEQNFEPISLEISKLIKLSNNIVEDIAGPKASLQSPESQSPALLTYRMDDGSNDKEDKESNNGDNEGSLFPIHGFEMENLEDDDQPTKDQNGGGGLATSEVIDDELTLDGGEGTDEVEEVGDVSEFPSDPQQAPPPHLKPLPAFGDTAPDTDSQDEVEDDEEGRVPEEDHEQEQDLEQDGDVGGSAEDDIQPSRNEGGPRPLGLPQMDSPGEDDDEDDDDDDMQVPPPEGSYNPADYDHLEVTAELKDLFTFIARYTPQNIELEHRLRPYIPDYIPAVGDIDAFIKIPRSDGENSTLGLTVLDEPSARQSDSTVLEMQLRAVAKQTTARSVVVKTVENGEKNGKVIEKWMRDISDLHRAKPPPTVHYAKRMPDIDSLMQEWPGEVEELLKEINLPSGALQVELPHYVDIVCSILDIPIYKSRIQSLHVLFTLFSVFKNSANFQHMVEENIMENDDSTQADQLVL